MWRPSALSGSDVITLAFRLPSEAFPEPESRNFMIVDTMLRAVLTMARVLVTMLLQINWIPPGGHALQLGGENPRTDGGGFNKAVLV